MVAYRVSATTGLGLVLAGLALLAAEWVLVSRDRVATLLIIGIFVFGLQSGGFFLCILAFDNLGWAFPSLFFGIIAYLFVISWEGRTERKEREKVRRAAKAR